MREKTRAAARPAAPAPMMAIFTSSFVTTAACAALVATEARAMEVRGCVIGFATCSTLVEMVVLKACTQIPVMEEEERTK